MNMSISFKTWYKQYKKNFSKREEQRRLIQEGLAPDQMADLFSNDDPSQEEVQEESLDWEYVTDYDISVDEKDESVYDYEQDESDENNKHDDSRMLQAISRNESTP
jgi:hypothetical protein